MPSDHRRLADVALRTVHGDETFTEIAELEEAIPILETVLEAGKEEVAREAGVDLSKFDDVARPYVQDIGALLAAEVCRGRSRRSSKYSRPMRPGAQRPSSPQRRNKLRTAPSSPMPHAWRKANAPLPTPLTTEKANGAAA